MDTYNIAIWPLKFIVTLTDLLSTSSPDRRGFLRAMRCLTDIVFKAPEVGAHIGAGESTMKFFESLSSWKKIFENKFKNLTERIKTYSDGLYNVGNGLKLAQKFKWVDLGKAAIPLGCIILITDIGMAALAFYESGKKIYHFTDENKENEAHIEKWSKGLSDVKPKHREKFAGLSEEAIKVKLKEKWETRKAHLRGEYCGHILNLPFQVFLTVMNVFSATQFRYTNPSICVVTFFGLAKLGVKTVKLMNDPVQPRKYHNLHYPRNGSSGC